MFFIPSRKVLTLDFFPLYITVTSGPSVLEGAGLKEGTSFIGGGLSRGILEIFCEKNRDPPTSQNGLMHDPSKIPTQKHLTLPTTSSETNITGRENN